MSAPHEPGWYWCKLGARSRVVELDWWDAAKLGIVACAGRMTPLPPEAEWSEKLSDPWARPAR